MPYKFVCIFLILLLSVCTKLNADTLRIEDFDEEINVKILEMNEEYIKAIVPKREIGSISMKSKPDQRYSDTVFININGKKSRIICKIKKITKKPGSVTILIPREKVVAIQIDFPESEQDTDSEWGDTLSTQEKEREHVPVEKFFREDGEKLVTREEAKVNKQKLLEDRKKAIDHFKEGNNYLDSEDYGKALAEFKKAIELYENIPRLQYNIGLLYGKLGKHKDAIKHLRKYCDLSPDADDRDGIITQISVLQGIINKKNKLVRKYEKRHEIMTKALPEIKKKCDMVLVPAGTFTMGINSIRREQRPSHKVYLDAFYIDRYEVTNAQYYEFLDYIEKTNDHSKCHKDEPINKSHKPLSWEKDYYNHPEYPIVRIDWYDAYAYAAWAGKRLPTEAEWEKAARGTDGRKWPWGNEWDPTKYNVGNPEPVGSHEEGKSPYGCHDMAGSVAEWCADWADLTYYEKSPKRNPKGPEKGDKKIIRGGSRFITVGLLLRSTARKTLSPQIGNMSVGFRCVK